MSLQLIFLSLYTKNLTLEQADIGILIRGEFNKIHFTPILYEYILNKNHNSEIPNFIRVLIRSAVLLYFSDSFEFHKVRQISRLAKRPSDSRTLSFAHLINMNINSIFQPEGKDRKLLMKRI
jgi:hypothetical protein